MSSDGFKTGDFDKNKADANRFKIRTMLANGLALKNQKKKSKFYGSPIIVSPSPSKSGEGVSEALNQCKRCTKIGPERWFRDETRQGWIIDICEDCQYILSRPPCSNITASETTGPSSVSLENASSQSSGQSSSQSSGQPSTQPEVVKRGVKRMNSQAALELEASDEQPAAKRTRAKNIRKPSQKVRDNTEDEEVLKNINMVQNAKKTTKKGERDSQHKARHQLDKLLSS
jgi:hypothetical protein